MENPEQDESEEVVTLADLATGKPAYEVCRILLASLQLANTGNIEIEAGGDDDGELRVLGVDEVRLRFRTADKVSVSGC